MFTIDQTYTTWTTERLLRHVLYWLAWLLFYGVVNSGYHDEPITTWIMVELVIMPTKMLYTYTVIYLLLPRYLIQKSYTPFIFWAIVLATLGGVLLRLVDVFVIGPAIFGEPLYSNTLFTPKFFYKVLDLIYVASLPAIIKLVQRYIQQEKQQQELVSEKLGAELQLLRNQLQPHFLFNTLNNLYGMVLSQHPRAGEVVMRLSNMMSYMLYDGNGPDIALDQEVEQLRNYIELEKIRYGERLEVSFETGGIGAEHRIPPLLLVAFWENAFKHGPARDDQPCWISGHLSVADNQLQFVLENSVTESATSEHSPKGGIGLTNVRKRLALVYPDRHDLKIEKGDTFTVNLKIDLGDQELGIGN